VTIINKKIRSLTMGYWKKTNVEDYSKGTEINNYCCLCGKIIPRNLWVVEKDNQELQLCDPECERIYRDYWLPKYGKG